MIFFLNCWFSYTFIFIYTTIYLAFMFFSYLFISLFSFSPPLIVRSSWQCQNTKSSIIVEVSLFVTAKVPSFTCGTNSVIIGGLPQNECLEQKNHSLGPLHLVICQVLFFATLSRILLTSTLTNAFLSKKFRQEKGEETQRKIVRSVIDNYFVKRL